jgi:hypothetical protein
MTYHDISVYRQGMVVTWYDDQANRVGHDSQLCQLMCKHATHGERSMCV